MKKEELVKSLEKLAEKLGISAEKVFSFYVKNAKLYQIYFFIYLSIVLVSFVVGILLANNNYEAVCISNESSFLQLTGFWGGIVLMLTGFVGSIVMVFCIPDLITAIKNPEYEAMEDLLTTLIS